MLTCRPASVFGRRLLLLPYFVFVLVVTGCSTGRQIYLVVDESSLIRSSEIRNSLKQSGLSWTEPKVEFPAGLQRSVVVYGDDRNTKEVALEIARTLSDLLGVFVPVKQSDQNNHWYTTKNIGIYIVELGSNSSISEAQGETFELTGGDSYEIRGCDRFEGTLLLQESGEYSIALLEYDAQDSFTNSDLSGNWSERDGLVEFVDSSSSERYTLEVRTVLFPGLGEVYVRELTSITRKNVPNYLFSHCSFLQTPKPTIVQ